MDYIVIKRFKGQAISGIVNLPYGTELQSKNGFIIHGDLPICSVRSQNAYDHFVVNDDGMGLERGRLIQAIIRTLIQKDALHQERWDKVWNCPRCKKYKRKEFADHWMWNHEFYNASIADLRHIAKLVGAKESG